MGKVPVQSHLVDRLLDTLVANADDGRQADGDFNLVARVEAVVHQADVKEFSAGTAEPLTLDGGRHRDCYAGCIMKTTLLPIAAILVSISSTASAQPISFGGEITAGTIVVDVNLNGNTGTVDLAGTNFHIMGVSQAIGGVAGGRCLFDFTCKRGETIDLSAFLSLEADGTAMVNGETLDPAFIVSGPAMQIQTEPVTIKGNRRFLTLRVPFTIAEPGASLDIYRDRTEWFAGSAGPWASGIVTGSGTATGYFERVHNPADGIGFYYELRRVVYSFD